MTGPGGGTSHHPPPPQPFALVANPPGVIGLHYTDTQLLACAECKAIISDNEMAHEAGCGWLADLRAQGAAAERERWRAAIVKLHAPFRIYDECDHEHTQEDVDGGRAFEIDIIGFTCENGFEYEVCVACCCDRDSEQTEECISSHVHGVNLPRCQTIRLLADLLDGDAQ